MSQRKGGTIQFQINGTTYLAKGNFSYNIGRPKREGITGADTVHGYKETPQIPFIEGEITDDIGLDLSDFVSIKDATVTLDLAIGKLIVIHDAYYAGEGTGNSEEGNIDCRFEALRGEEI